MSEADPIQVPVQDVSPQVRDSVRAIFEKWQSGDLAYQDALEQFALLRAAHSKAADQGQIEIQVGMMQGYRGNYNAAIEHFEKARELFLEVGNRRLITNCTMNLGETYRLRGDYTRARQYFNAAYEAAVAIGAKPAQVIARTNEAQTFISQGRYESAAAILRECHDFCLEPWETPEPETMSRRRLEQLCEVTYAQAWVCLETNRPNEAWEYAAQSLKHATEHNSSLVVGMANRIVGEALTLLGKAPEGYLDSPDDYFAAATTAFREIKADGEIARTLFAHGKSLGRRNNKSLGARKLQQATVIFTKLGMMDDAAKAAEAQLKLLR